MLSGVAARLAPAAIVGAWAYGIKSIVQEIGNVSKQSAMLGLTTDEFQIMAKAADEGGSNVEAYAKALSKLKLVIGSGGGKGIAALGLDPKALGKLSSMDAFMRVVDALSKVDNQYRRAAIAALIFGKGAAEIGPLLAEGSSALQGYQNELQKTGQLFTADTESRTRVFLDQLESTWGSIKGWLTETWEAIEPIVSRGFAALRLLVLTFKEGGQAIAWIMIKAGEGILWMADKFLAAAQALASMIPRVGTAMAAEIAVQRGMIKSAQASAGGTENWLEKAIFATADDMESAWGDVFGSGLEKKQAEMEEKLRKQRKAGGGGAAADLLGGGARQQASEFKQVDSLARLASSGTAGVNGAGNQIQWPAGEEILRRIEENTAGAEPVLA